MKKVLLVLILNILTSQWVSAQKTKDWALLPFEKADQYNPILGPKADTKFDCPISKKSILWEEKDVYNPAAVVKDGKVYLLYRAEDTLKSVNGTSRIGIAISDDGIHFKRHPKPVLYPDNDFMKAYEWPGGCEDPRVVKSENGEYIMTYTTYDGKTARLCVATSKDLFHWTKKGLAFTNKYHDLWSKSGAIVSKPVKNEMIATKIKGYYYMYFGDTDIFLAKSKDLIHWQVIENDQGKPKKIFGPRLGKFDSRLVESGPPAMITKNGILLLYNGMNLPDNGRDMQLPPDTYASGQILLDVNNPEKVLDRLENYFLKPDQPYELNGQVNQVVFIEGLVYFKNKYFLYYGTADSKIAVAIKIK